MKISKKASQHNVVLNSDYYREVEIKDLLDRKILWFFDKDYAQSNSYELFRKLDWFENPVELRIFTDDLAELKIILNEDKQYETVGIGHDGTVYHIIL